MRTKDVTALGRVGLAAAAVGLAGCAMNGDAARGPSASQETGGGAEAPDHEDISERAFTRTRYDVTWGPCPEFMPDSCGLAVVQGDPDEQNADVLLRMAPGTMLPEHWHTSAERMVLIAGQMQVDYEGQQPVTLSPGTYAYGPPKLPHEAFCAEGEACVLFIAFEEPVDAVPVQ